MSNTYLSFTVCGEQFAVNVQYVLEVLQNQNITSIPNAPDYIKGIINFRGEIVPVFESRTQFNLPARDENQSFVIVVFDLSEENEIFRIGAIVDFVKDVINIEDSEIKPVPAMNKEFNTDFLWGIFKLHDDFILLLNIEKVFKYKEFTEMKETFKQEEKVTNKI